MKKKEYTNIFQLKKIYTYCSMEKQYVEMSTKMVKKSLLFKGK